MAQRKSPPSRTSRPSSNKPGTRATGSSASRGRPSGSPASKPAARKPPKGKSKSIVNQRQTPWGLIIVTAVIVAFAAAIVGVVIATHKSSSPSANCSAMIGNNRVSYLNENVCAKDINGVTFKPEAQRNHIPGVIHYDSSPPVGGNHSQYWADCTGTVYPQAIANENAVHMLEHGAIWITYNAKTLPASQLAKLKTYVQGVNRTALSPYPNLKTPISLQAWGYQLFLHSASDPRIAEFIAALKYNPKTTPEYGASCSDPLFVQHPSTFGHPLWTPANGGTGGTMSPSAH
jgi:hypothetical protein